jgi:DNA repair exonuclease SbcCD nuclease subunit
MPDFTFLHAADLHIDSPLRGLDAAAPAERIRMASREALTRLVELALQRQVAFVVLAGDLYDGDAKDWRTGQFLVQQLTRLTREGIEIVAISGNHDADQVLTRKLPVPGMLGFGKPETRLLSHVPVAVHGQSFATRAVLENLVLRYPRRIEEKFNIGLLHTACGMGGHENFAPCTVGDLERLEYDYWALGHVHIRQVLSTDPWVLFPGNLQGRHVKEEGAKGATIVSVTNLRVEGVPEHVPLDVVRWRRLPVDVTGAADERAVLDRAGFLLNQAVLEAEGRMLAVRISLIGECPAHADLARSPEALLQNMRAAALDVAGPDEVWIEDVKLLTAPVLDLPAMRAQPGAVGMLVSALDRPVAVDKRLADFVSDQLRRADQDLESDHPALAIRDGHIPDDILARARALLLAELARD